MSTLKSLYQHFRHIPELRRYSLYGVCFLVIMIWLNYVAGTFAFSRMSNGVHDLILDNIPRIDVSFVFVEGAVLMTVFLLLLALRRPTYIPAILFNVGFFYAVRAVAIILTHIGPPLSVGNMTLATSITGRFTEGADYFFSGHTGYPFVIALVFWEVAWIRNLFFTFSFFFAVTALLGHLHYSIDVFSAPFIAHSVVTITRHFWPKLWHLKEAKI